MISYSIIYRAPRVADVKQGTSGPVQGLLATRQILPQVFLPTKVG